MSRKFGYKQAVLILMSIVVYLFVLSGTTLASTPTITEFSPAPGTAFTTNEANISFRVKDPDEIKSSEFYIKVNGTLIDATIYYPIGHWEDDSCGGYYWYIDNYTEAVISGKAKNLTDGLQPIEVSAKDNLDNQVTYSWGVFGAIKPVFSNPYPANGTIAGGSSPITVKLTDNIAIDPLSIILKIDGNQVMQKFDSTTGIVSYQSPSKLTDGTYSVWASAKDLAGNTVTTSWSFNVLNQPPTLVEYNPANGTILTASDTPISFKVTDTYGIASSGYSIKVNGTEISSIIDYPIGHWEDDGCGGTYWAIDDYTQAVISGNAASLKNGPQNIEVTANNQLGNTLTFNWGITVALANQYPTLLENSPANGTILTKGETPISFKISDPDTIPSNGYSINVNGSLISSSVKYPVGYWKIEANGSSTWVVDDYTQAVISGNVSNLKDGPQTIDITAKDALGNQLVYRWGITVAERPTFTDQSPASGTTVNGNVPISVKVFDNTKVDPFTIILKVDSSQVQHTYDAATGVISYQSPSRLTDGNHTIWVSAKDTSGNEASTTWNFSVVNPVNNGPTLLEYSPNNGATITSSSPQISFKISDQDTIAGSGYYIKVNGTAISSIIHYPIGHWEEDTCGSSYWVIDDYTQGIISGTAANLKDGLQKIEVSAKDALGNALVYNWEFTVGAPPTFASQSPASGTATTGLTPISVIVSDNNAVNPLSIVLSLDGIIVPHSYDPLTGMVSYQAPTRLADGSHTVNITAKDTSGISATNSWSFTVLTSGPQLALIDEGKTVTTSSALFKVSAFSSQRINNTSAVLQIDGISIPTTFAYNSANNYTQGTISGTGSNLAEGPHKLKATIADSLGNTSSKEWNFNVNYSPTLSAPLPENQSSTNVNSGFTVMAYDKDRINISTLVAKLDNVQVPANFDESTGKISYKPNSPISDGSHTVNITIADALGNTTNYSWSFIVQTIGPTLVNTSGNSFETYKPSLVVSAKSLVKISDTENIVQIDNNPVDFSFTYKGHYSGTTWIVDSYTEATINSNPIPLSDGRHTLSVSVKDILGNSTTQSWTFNVAQKPTIDQQTPANESSINKVSTLIVAAISDLNDLTINKGSIIMSVDNVKVTPNISENNGKVLVSYNAVNLKDEEYHTVSVTAADPTGNSNTSSWRFYISVKGDMLASSADCGSCHTINISSNKYVHSTPPFGGDCDHCHGNYEPNFCGYCHDYGGTQDLQYQRCTYCHTNTPNIYFGLSGNQVVMRQVNMTSKPPQLQPGNILVHDIYQKHYINKGTCNTCHSVNLTSEHNRVNKQGIQINCTTCHKSANPKVQGAIAAKNRDCFACHEGNHDISHESNLNLKCQSCHNSKIDLEHINGSVEAGKGYSCSTCHSSSNIDVKLAIVTKNLSCNSCHSQFHSLTLGLTIPADIPLLSDFTWSKPISTDFIIGEISMPTGYQPGKYVISNRKNDITSDEIWYYYNEQLTANGWVLNTNPPLSGEKSFTAEYQKGQRYLYIKCLYKGEAPLGYRIELWYK